MDWVDSLFV